MGILNFLCSKPDYSKTEEFLVGKKVKTAFDAALESETWPLDSDSNLIFNVLLRLQKSLGDYSSTLVNTPEEGWDDYAESLEIDLRGIITAVFMLAALHGVSLDGLFKHIPFEIKEHFKKLKISPKTS